jgi:hypothetical protein
MDEVNTPVSDLKREQSDPSAVSQNGLDASTSDALNQSAPALDEGIRLPFGFSFLHQY